VADRNGIVLSEQGASAGGRWFPASEGIVVAISTVNPDGTKSADSRRADSAASYPAPPVAGTVGRADDRAGDCADVGADDGLVEAVELTVCRAAEGWLAEAPHPVIVQTAATATSLRSIADPPLPT